VASEPQSDPSTEPFGAPPDDADAFDDWARRGHDTWQRGAVVAEAARRWADTDRAVPDRLLAGIWGASAGTPPASELLALVDDGAVGPVLRGRALAVAAVDMVAVRSDDALQLIEQALAAMGPAVPVRTRLSVWFAAAEVWARAGQVVEALGVLDQAGQEVGASSDAPPWALVAIDAQRLSLQAGQVQNREHLAGAADQVASAALRLDPTPSVVDVLIKMCGIFRELGAARRAEHYAERVLEATVGQPEALGPRFQAQLILAEVLAAAEGPEAALVPQRAAIDTVTPLGDSPMLGWAQRGLARSLRALDRNTEAAEEFGRAADTYARVGALVEPLVNRLDQAEALLYADRSEEAAAIVEQVQGGLDQLPESDRNGVALRAHVVRAHLSAADGDLDDAAEQWLEVAELAPEVGRSDLEARLTAAQLYAALGDDAEADAQFLRAELSAADAPDPAKATATVMRARVDVLRDADRWDEAAELARVAANLARTSGDDAQAIYLSVIAADSLHRSGSSAAAVQLYEDTLGAARDANLPQLEGAVHAGLADVLRDLGRTEEADAHAAEAQARNPGAPPRR
jgi:tetratricopeptide (TPR) repeat protein